MQNDLVIIDNLGLIFNPGKVNEKLFLRYNEKFRNLISKKKIYSIGRSSNPDGILGPSLIVHNYKIKKDRLLLAQQSEYAELLKKIKKMNIKDSVVIFSDLSFGKTGLNYGIRILDLLKSSNNIVIWLDHHPWEPKTVKAIRNKLDFVVFGESGVYSAAELVYLFLCRKDRTSNRLATIAHYSDFVVQKERKLINRLEYAIVYTLQNTKNKEMNLKKIVYIASELKFDDSFILNAYQSYIKKDKENKKTILKNTKLIKTAKYRIGVGFTKGLQTNSACYYIMDKFGLDISIYINTETGKCGIRSRENIDSSFIAMDLGGGGHPRASGFEISGSELRNLSKNGNEKLLSSIEKIVKNHYS